jgi:hypothetical protein
MYPRNYSLHRSSGNGVVLRGRNPCLDGEQWFRSERQAIDWLTANHRGKSAPIIHVTGRVVSRQKNRRLKTA